MERHLNLGLAERSQGAAPCTPSPSHGRAAPPLSRGPPRRSRSADGSTPAPGTKRRLNASAFHRLGRFPRGRISDLAPEGTERDPRLRAPPATPRGRGRRGDPPYLAARGGGRPGGPSGRRRGCSPRGPSRIPASPGRRSAPASSSPRWSGAKPRRSRRG